MLFMNWKDHRRGINSGRSPRFLRLHISRGRAGCSMGGGGLSRLYGYGSPSRIWVINLERSLSSIFKHRQKHVLTVASCPIAVHVVQSPNLKTKLDSFMSTLVRLLIEKMTPIRERIVWRTVLGGGHPSDWLGAKLKPIWPWRGAWK